MTSSKTLDDQSKDVMEQDANSALVFAEILNRLNQKQAEFKLKLENEKRKRDHLEDLIQKTRANLRTIQSKTRNGNIVRETSLLHSKSVQLSEKKLQAEKVKLSLAKTENIEMHYKIDDLRREKLLQSKIKKSRAKELKQLRDMVKTYQAEVVASQNRKQETEADIIKAKTEFANSRKEYTNDLISIRKSIESAQKSILEAIQERIRNYSFSKSIEEEDRQTIESGSNSDMEKDSVCKTSLVLVDTLVPYSSVISSSPVSVDPLEEERWFVLNSRIQTQLDDLDSLQAENSKMNEFLKQKELEIQEKVKIWKEQENILDQEICRIKNEINDSEKECARFADTFIALSPSLTKLFQQISISDESRDQQLLFTRINQHNLPDFLAIFEQRVNDLIQISDYLDGQSIQSGQFLTHLFHRPQCDKKGIIKPQNIPSVTDNEYKEYKESSLLPLSRDEIYNEILKRAQERLKNSDNRSAVE